MRSSFLPNCKPKIYKDFCPTIQTRIIALFFGDFLVRVGSFFGYDPCLFGKAEILVIFCLHFARILTLTDLYLAQKYQNQHLPEGVKNHISDMLSSSFSRNLYCYLSNCSTQIVAMVQTGAYWVLQHPQFLKIGY